MDISAVLTKWKARTRGRHNTTNIRGGRSCASPASTISRRLDINPASRFLLLPYLSPVATFFLVLLTLFGALPIYNRVAQESPKGEGSIAMLEALLSRWKGKLFVLILLGFVATDFVITITLSAADATAHVLENPFVRDRLSFFEHPVVITLILISLLGAVFIRGFKEAIEIAVILGRHLFASEFVTISVGLYEMFTHPDLLQTGERHFCDQGRRHIGGSRRSSACLCLCFHGWRWVSPALRPALR